MQKSCKCIIKQFTKARKVENSTTSCWVWHKMFKRNPQDFCSFLYQWYSFDWMLSQDRLKQYKTLKPGSHTLWGLFMGTVICSHLWSEIFCFWLSRAWCDQGGWLIWVGMGSPHSNWCPSLHYHCVWINAEFFLFYNILLCHWHCQQQRIWTCIV